MSEYKEQLDSEGWSKLYNQNIIEDVVNTIEKGKVSVWSEELVRICVQNEHEIMGINKPVSVLEVGCGSGVSSLWLSKNGAKVTALDYSDKAVQLVQDSADRLGVSLRVVHADATKPLPFEPKEFDFVFQAGVLEHFEVSEQIELLNNWKQYGKVMISMIPNAASLPYRVGKEISEIKGIWPYGREIPEHTFVDRFSAAGIELIREYSIGSTWAYGFLPKRHYVKRFFERMRKEGYDLESMMQGYLLVTVGKC